MCGNWTKCSERSSLTWGSTFTKETGRIGRKQITNLSGSRRPSAFSFLCVQNDRQKLHAHCILSSLEVRFTSKDDDDVRFGFSGACTYQNLARACDHSVGSKHTVCFVLFLKMLVSRLSLQVWDVSATLLSKPRQESSALKLIWHACLESS